MASLDSDQIDQTNRQHSVLSSESDGAGSSVNEQVQSSPSHETPLSSYAKEQTESFSRLRQVIVDDVGVALPETFARVVLSDVDRRSSSFIVPVSMDQAAQIAAAMRGVKPPRPFSHELIASVLLGFDLRVEFVAITGIQQGNFIGEVTIASIQGKVKTFESRASDAILMALSSDLPVPILADVSLLSG